MKNINDEVFVSEAFVVFLENYHDLAPDTKPHAYILKHQSVQQRAVSELRDHSEWLVQTKNSTLEACDPDFLFSEEIQKIIDTTLNQLPKKHDGYSI